MIGIVNTPAKMGNPVTDVTESSGTVTVTKLDSTTNSFTTGQPTDLVGLTGSGATLTLTKRNGTTSTVTINNVANAKACSGNSATATLAANVTAITSGLSKVKVFPIVYANSGNVSVLYVKGTFTQNPAMFSVLLCLSLGWNGGKEQPIFGVLEGITGSDNNVPGMAVTLHMDSTAAYTFKTSYTCGSSFPMDFNAQLFIPHGYPVGTIIATSYAVDNLTVTVDANFTNENTITYQGKTIPGGGIWLT